MSRPTIKALQETLAHSERERSAAIEACRRHVSEGFAKQRESQQEIDELKRRLNNEILVAKGLAIEVLRKYDQTPDASCQTCNPELRITAGPYRQCVPHCAAAYLLGQGAAFR